MSKYNAKNVRIRREYLEWQKEANQKSDTTIDNIRKAIDRYERYTDFTDFKTFHKQKAIAFKRHLSELKSKQHGEPLSKSTVSSTLRHVKDFFKWLAYQKGYKTIDVNHVEYFNLGEKDLRAAKARKFKDYPTIDQIRAVLAAMPTQGDVAMRNRALVAFTLLTGMRDSAIASLKLKHIRLSKDLVEQRGDEVKTKFSKTIFTYFFPVGEDIKAMATDWIEYLRKEKLFGDNDPVFPRTKMALDDNSEFKADGVESEHWQSAGQIRKIFQEAFEAAGLDYYTPHTLRTTLSRFGEEICQGPEEFKAWSQNLGHEHVMTTFTSYGEVEESRQGEILRGLADYQAGAEDDMDIGETLTKVLTHLRRKKRT